MRTAPGAKTAAAGAFVAIGVLFAADAVAFCRTVSKPPPPGWNLATQGCFTGDGGDAKELYWQKACIGYSLQREASRQVPLDQATAITASAFAAWTGAVCSDGRTVSIEAVDQGPVECSAVQYNKNQPNQNVIVFRDDAWPYSDPNSTLGLTTVTFDTTTGELLGADMEINATQKLVVRNVRESEDGYDLAAIMTHEAGHFLGLAHSAIENAIMYARYKDGAQLVDDDAAGVCAVYTTDGRRATSAGSIGTGACDPTPPHGFSSACASPGGANDDHVSTKSSCAFRRAPASGAGVVSGLALMAVAFGMRRWSGARRPKWGGAACRR